MTSRSSAQAHLSWKGGGAVVDGLVSHCLGNPTGRSDPVIPWDLCWICFGPVSHVWDTGPGGLGLPAQGVWNSDGGTRRGGGGRSPILRQHHVQYMSGRKMSASLDCHMQTKIIQNQQQKAQWTWVDVMCCKGMSSRGAVMLVERFRSRFSRGTDKRDSDEFRVERLPGRSANKATM